MPLAMVNGLELYYEEAGTGFPLVWNHEFAGDCRSLDLQVRHFARRYRVITYNYRGWPPSAVPESAAAYSTDALVDDLAGLLRHLEIPARPSRRAVDGREHRADVRRALPGGGGQSHRRWLRQRNGQSPGVCGGIGAAGARLSRTQGARVAGEEIAQRAARRVYAEKDPRGYAEFVERLHAHSAHGAAAAIRGILVRRKTIFEMQDDLKEIVVPTLIVVGDQDDGAVEPSLFLRRSIPHARLLVFPFTGHIPNLEEPGLFNLHVGEFLAAVAEGRWAHSRGDSTNSGRLS